MALHYFDFLNIFCIKHVCVFLDNILFDLLHLTAKAFVYKFNSFTFITIKIIFGLISAILLYIFYLLILIR